MNHGVIDASNQNLELVTLLDIYRLYTYMKKLKPILIAHDIYCNVTKVECQCRPTNYCRYGGSVSPASM